MSRLNVTWLDGNREPKCPPNPDFPNGIDVDVTRGAKVLTCETDLPYPAPRCGSWLIQCANCGQNVIVTAAGRVDDPRSIKLVCRASSLMQPGVGSA